MSPLKEMPPQKDEGNAQKQVGIYFHPPTYHMNQCGPTYMSPPTYHLLNPIVSQELNLLTPK
jgi:hypothetical protein